MSIDLNSSDTNTIGDKKENRWELLPEIQAGLEELLEQNSQNSEIKNLLKALEKLVDLKNKVNEQESSLKLGKLIILRERNVYLDKLRKIEEFGDKEDWKDSDGILNQIKSLLYND